MRTTLAPALAILIYHRVLARPDPLFPDQVDAARFTRHLGLLRRCFNVLPLADALRRLDAGTLPARAACITFDDGYADNAQVALPLLQQHGMTACFFVATAYLDGGRMWNDSVTDAVRAAPGPLLDLTRHGLGRHAIGSHGERRSTAGALLRGLKYLPFSQRQALAEAIGAAVRGPGPMMSGAQVQLLHRAGMEIGAHTDTHPILSTLAERSARSDIRAGKRRLEQLTGAPVRLFAYPNGEPGLDYGARDTAIVRDLGFEAAVSTHWGVVRASTDRFQLPRFTPWDHSRLGFLLRMAGNRLRPDPSTVPAGGAALARHTSLRADI